MAKPQYLVNLLQHNLTCNNAKEGDELFIKLARGEYFPISDAEAKNKSVQQAVSRGWAKIVDTEPDTGKANAVPVEITITKPYLGISEAELQEEKAKEAKAPKKQVATGTAIGQNT